MRNPESPLAHVAAGSLMPSGTPNFDPGDWVRDWSARPDLDPETRAMLPAIARAAARNGGTFTAEDVLEEIHRGGDA